MMKVVAILCIAVAIVHGGGESRSSEETGQGIQKAHRRSRNDCIIIARTLYQGVQLTLRQIPQLAIVYQTNLGIDARKFEDYRKLACSIINVTTLQQLAELIPPTYDRVKRFYTDFRQIIIARGGYTSYYRFPAIRFEVGKWANSKGFTSSDVRISAHVDLETFTEFMETMQVTYGSDWLSALVDSPNAVVITDVKKFAQDLFNSKTAAELQRTTGLDEGKAEILINAFGWQTAMFQDSWNKEQLNFRLIELLGRNGLLNLE